MLQTNFTFFILIVVNILFFTKTLLRNLFQNFLRLKKTTKFSIINDLQNLFFIFLNNTDKDFVNHSETIKFAIQFFKNLWQNWEKMLQMSKKVKKQ